MSKSSKTRTPKPTTPPELLAARAAARGQIVASALGNPILTGAGLLAGVAAYARARGRAFHPFLRAKELLSSLASPVTISAPVSAPTFEAPTYTPPSYTPPSYTPPTYTPPTYTSPAPTPAPTPTPVPTPQPDPEPEPELEPKPEYVTLIDPYERFAAVKYVKDPDRYPAWFGLAAIHQQGDDYRPGGFLNHVYLAETRPPPAPLIAPAPKLQPAPPDGLIRKADRLDILFAKEKAFRAAPVGTWRVQPGADGRPDLILETPPNYTGFTFGVIAAGAAGFAVGVMYDVGQSILQIPSEAAGSLAGLAESFGDHDLAHVYRQLEADIRAPEPHLGLTVDPNAPPAYRAYQWAVVTTTAPGTTLGTGIRWALRLIRL